jgi:hypothetical protein
MDSSHDAYRLEDEEALRKALSHYIGNRKLEVYWIPPFPFAVIFRDSTPPRLVGTDPDSVEIEFSKIGNGVWTSCIYCDGARHEVTYREASQAYEVRVKLDDLSAPDANAGYHWENLSAMRIIPLVKRMRF